jgi:CheY-like chemotaxis protein
VNQLVVGMSEMLSRTLGERIRVETQLAGAVWRCVVDPNQLETALLNLALNARDAMPEGGKLVLQTANMRFRESYTARYEGIEPGEYIMLAVSDSGIGIPADHLAKVFEPFFTTKEVGKGSGLGLAQVYGFVRQSGGHVTVYSEVGIGTTIRIYLRRDETAEEPDDGPEHRRETPLAQAGEQILVVEDDAPVRDYSVAALRGLGYRVLEAADARAALELIEGRRDIDLLFTDVGLPGMNGRLLAETVGRRRPGLKILFTTGYAGAALASDGTLGPNARVLQKPFTRETLAERIRAALDDRAVV